jgi:alkylhydroperoxidase/carboxymuconolactone decarboxylase family protein YurZ
LHNATGFPGVPDQGKEERVLPSGLEERFTSFYHEAYADGEVDGKTKILIGMAVASAVGCYP